ncbi:hypothetical protein GB937_003009 [Aspergillus fischeri]|nr:hypothetical protein GB937_003009 [Aspergillus fischeri]
MPATDNFASEMARRLDLERRYGGKKPVYFLFTKEDLIGPDRGLEQVKERVGSVVRTLGLNYRREPRTGKTTVGKLYGRILATWDTLVAEMYAADFVDELIHFLSQESHQGSMVAILAGYMADMNCLLSARPERSPYICSKSQVHLSSAGQPLAHKLSTDNVHVNMPLLPELDGAEKHTPAKLPISCRGPQGF